MKQLHEHNKMMAPTGQQLNERMKGQGHRRSTKLRTGYLEQLVYVHIQQAHMGDCGIRRRWPFYVTYALGVHMTYPSAVTTPPCVLQVPPQSHSLTVMPGR